MPHSCQRPQSIPSQRRPLKKGQDLESVGGILHTSLCCQLASMYAFSLGPFDVHVGIRNRGRGAACRGHHFQLVQESLSSLKRCLAWPVAHQSGPSPTRPRDGASIVGAQPGNGLRLFVSKRVGEEKVKSPTCLGWATVVRACVRSRLAGCWRRGKTPRGTWKGRRLSRALFLEG